MTAGSWLTALNTRKMDYALVIAAQKRRIRVCSGLTGRSCYGRKFARIVLVSGSNEYAHN